MSLKEDRQFQTTYRNSCQIANHHRFSFHSIYELIVDSLEHITVAIAPAQGPTGSVFVGPVTSCRDPRCIP